MKTLEKELESSKYKKLRQTICETPKLAKTMKRTFNFPHTTYSSWKKFDVNEDTSAQKVRPSTYKEHSKLRETQT